MIDIKNITKFFKCFLIIGSYLVYPMVGIIIVAICGMNVESITDKQMNLIGLISSIIYLLIIVLIYRKSLKKEFIDFRKNAWHYLSRNAMYWIIGLTIMFASNLIISRFIPGGATNEQLVQNEIFKFPIYMIWSACIFAPITEEVLFRKTLRELFPTNLVFVLMSGILFGYIHTLANFGSPIELLYIIPYGAVGSMFAYMYVKTKNIFVPITFHAIHNIVLVLLSIIINVLAG